MPASIFPAIGKVALPVSLWLLMGEFCSFPLRGTPAPTGTCSENALDTAGEVTSSADLLFGWLPSSPAVTQGLDRCTASWPGAIRGGSGTVSWAVSSAPQTTDPPGSKTTADPQKPAPTQTETDPFADLPPPPPKPPSEEPKPTRWRAFFADNFGFRKELMSEFDAAQNAHGASRQSVGFEVLKKFSTATTTVASFDFQGRLVRRDGWNPVLNDMEGRNRQGWVFEYHNLYLDLYNILNPVLTDAQRSKNVGRFHFRVGRFYVPFGLNLQTDTHGTVLQLSNERNFGFERDWYAGFWGALNKHLNYDVYYLVGSGYDLKFKGQGGLGAVRISLSNRYSSEYGLEGGLSILAGQRLASETRESTPHALTPAGSVSRIETQRIGLDGRYRRPVPKGTLTLTSEVSGGRDVPDAVRMQLYQAEYLHASRRWGVASQYRRFRQDGFGADESLFGEFTWYFRNDVSSSAFHWIKLNAGHQRDRIQGKPGALVALQYYFYW
jgi:hypothetical protein